MKKFRIDEITINLDNLRKPLNSQQRKEMSKKKLYPYYGANNLMDYIDEYIFDEEILCVAEDGGSWGYKEKCSYIVNEKCWVNNHAHILKAKENLNLKYLMYYLNYNDLTNKITGTTRGKLTKSALNSIEIKLPLIEEQNKIVILLEKAQALIHKRKKQIEELDLLVKSKFIEMFGNPLNNSKGWRETTLDYYTNLVTYGLTVRPNYIEEGIPLISAKEIRAGVVGYENAPKISVEDYNQLSDKGKPKKHDILFSKTGSIGHCALVESNEIFAITQNAARISLNLDIINPVWCLYYLRTDYIQEWCQKKSKGNAVKDFQLQDMKKIPIFICDKNLQNQFADFVKQVDKLKFEMEKSLKELEDNFNSLMQKAFKGELFK